MIERQRTEQPIHLRIRAERKRRGWTQTEAATRAGMKLRAWQDFESGKTTPQPGNLHAILEAFDVEDANEDAGEQAREAWPADIHVFLDMMGAFLATMPEAERLAFMHEETRRIIGRPRG